MGGRRTREAQQQAKRLRRTRLLRQPHMLALARVILESRIFQRLVDRLDTREGATRWDARLSREPAPRRPSDRLLPEKGPFVPPLGDLIFRTRIVQRTIGGAFSGVDAPAKTGATDGKTNETLPIDPGEDRSPATRYGDQSAKRHSQADSELTDAELRVLRQKALISSLLHSSMRWGGR